MNSGFKAMLAAMFAFSAPHALADEAPATVWNNGTIITMRGEAPEMVEAVVTRGDRIVFVGSLDEARDTAGNGAIRRDLAGRTMLPGFLDAHSHFGMALESAGRLDLGNPANGRVADFASLQAAIARHIEANTIEPGGWVVAMRYNEQELAEKRHITRTELDAAFPGYKVVLIHISGHGLVASGPALAAVGIDAGTPTPEGGVIVRDEQGKPNGVLFERAMFLVVPRLPLPTVEQKLAALEAVQTMYLAEGYVHAQDGATSPEDLAFLTSPEVASRLKLDLALLPLWTQVDAMLANPAVRSRQYLGHVKIEGVKFVLDGSPQARTAYFTRDYALGAPDGSHPWHGQPVTSAEEFVSVARMVDAAGWQIFAHANGDAAIDMAIAGFDTLGILAAQDKRPVVIHSQFQRPDQLAQYARIGVSPAYFTNHTYFWGDVHRTNFDSRIVDFISPMRAAREAGLTVSNHTDFPVTPLDTRFMIWSAMSRQSKTGIVSGADQRIDSYAALQALTTGPAFQMFEDHRKGRIAPGLQADFVILDRNPLTTPVEDIRSIKVLETVVDGRTMWKAED